MPTLSLRQAATEAGTSKSTILRAIHSGRLSASRTDDGGYAIDPAELFRVYPPDRTMTRSAGQDAPALDQGVDHTVALRIRNAELETQISSLRELVEAERRRADASERRSDQLHQLVDRLALAPPVPTVAVAAPPEPATPWHRFLRWRRAG